MRHTILIIGFLSTLLAKNYEDSYEDSYDDYYPKHRPHYHPKHKTKIKYKTKYKQKIVYVPVPQPIYIPIRRPETSSVDDFDNNRRPTSTYNNYNDYYPPNPTPWPLPPVTPTRPPITLFRSQPTAQAQIQSPVQTNPGILNNNIQPNSQVQPNVQNSLNNLSNNIQPNSPPVALPQNNSNFFANDNNVLTNNSDNPNQAGNGQGNSSEAPTPIANA
ncbi:hypothetical protein K502DRAFT_350954 [Neoconidiobolus thromboides FSU 785]|nr:hypothetical protein K502DRAFT_350954 [Neoconidiobolus thromboides FSU 785]